MEGVSWINLAVDRDNWRAAVLNKVQADNVPSGTN
jgi:hypothetical protein